MPAQPPDQATEAVKQLGGQLFSSLLDKLMRGKGTPPAATPAPATADAQQTPVAEAAGASEEAAAELPAEAPPASPE